MTVKRSIVFAVLIPALAACESTALSPGAQGGPPKKGDQGLLPWSRPSLKERSLRATYRI